MAEIVIRAGSGTPEDHESAEELAARLRARDHSVAIEKRKRKDPERTGNSTYPWMQSRILVEQVAIFIGAGAATTLLSSVITDVYNVSKDWALKQFRKRRTDDRTPRMNFTIHGPDGEWRSLEIDQHGETEERGRNMDPDGNWLFWIIHQDGVIDSWIIDQHGETEERGVNIEQPPDSPNPPES
jgi:hypothetical protein